MKRHWSNVFILSLLTTGTYAAESRFSELEEYVSQFTKPDEKIKLIIKGISGEIEDNVAAYIGDLSQEDLQQWRETQARIRKASREALEAVGYYQSDIKITQQDQAVVLTIQVNQSVIIGKINLEYQGEASNDIVFTVLRDNLAIKEGQVLHHGKYENAKSLLQNTALERGYFDAKWLKHEVIIDQATQQATINLVYDSGKRYKFGQTFFSGANQSTLPVDLSLLVKFIPFKEGEDYEADKVIKLNKSLLDSRYFNQVKVRAESELAEAYAVPVNVSVMADKPNQLDLGAGYATDVGARISSAWRRPLFNQKGHSIEIVSELSQVRQSLTTRYGIPWTHPINDILQITAGVKREDIDDSATTNNSVLGIERQIKWESGWQTNTSLRWTRETYHQDSGEKGQSDLLLPSYGVSRVRTKGSKTDPERGDRQYYQIEFASPDFLSDADLLALRAGWKWLNTFANRHQLGFRADVGAIFSSNFESVPLDMRFYAGGDQSVRGYDYKSLSPRDSDNQVIGASNLISLSTEYTFKFTNKWRLATFVDSGNAFDSASEALKVGTGFGVRWISPVGPVRLDIAWPLDNLNNTPRIHFFMGPAL